MKICMLGAGSLGSTIGGVLAKGGHDVTFFDTYKEHIDEINKNGLLMVNSLEDKGCYVNIKATDDYSQIPQQDLIIVLVKSFATQQAVAQAKQAGLIGKNTVVMTIQNGLGNEEAIMEIVGEENVISGKTFVSGFLISPGKVMATAEGRVTYIGEMNGDITPRIINIGNELSGAGIEAIVSDNIKGMIWDKLLVNVATGAISGITGLTYGGLYEKYNLGAIPQLKETACAAIAETIAVAAAHGIKLSTQNPEDPWNNAAEGQPHSFKASILQSIERGVASEIDFINGAVCQWGKKVGVKTPVNDTLVALIKAIEYKQNHK